MKINKFLFSGLLFVSATAMSAPWQTGISAYDINGKPYTGKAYINEMMWVEKDFENGVPIRILTDMCMRGFCEKQEIIQGTPYIRLRSENGVVLNGMIKESPKKEGEWNQHGQEGLYINGVPDGLHKEFDEQGLIKETMYDKGKTIWQKEYKDIIPSSPYTTLKANIRETIHDGGVITERYYKDNQKILEIKKLFDERLIELALYEDSKILMRQRFYADGTSQAENFVNNTKKDLPKNQIYDLYKTSKGWIENHPYNYTPYDGIFNVIAGKHLVCSGIIEEPDLVQCFKDMNASPFNATPLSKKQLEVFHRNPSEFFTRNELGLDLSDVGEPNIKELNVNAEEKMNQFSEVMITGMQGMMQGMSEGMFAAETEDELKEIVQKRINESVSTGSR